MRQVTIPEYYRTEDELTKPFMSCESPVRRAGLTLISVETKEFLLPETKLWEETGDPKLVARMLTEQTRAWSNSVLLSSKYFAGVRDCAIIIRTGGGGGGG